MIHIKQYILTLVALLALTTQAWAEVDLSNKIWQPGDQFNIGEAWFYYDDTNKNKFYHTNGVESQVPSFQYDGHYKQWYFDSFVKVNKQIDNDTESQLSTTTSTTRPIWLSVPDGKTSTDQPVGFKIVGGDGSKEHPYKFGLVYELPSGTPFPITWSAATRNTASIAAMPAGNVEVNVEYYPQATVADGGVTANTQAKATTDEPLVNVDVQSLTGATKLMYFVSETNTTAPDYDAVGWTDVVPTAAGYTEATDVYVWYYPIGTVGTTDAETYSDGNMNATAIRVSVGDVPTYDVTFAEGTDLNEWSATPNTGITKGTEVTITYTGTRKVIGVKAEIVEPPFAADEYKEGSWDDTNKKVVFARKKATTTPTVVTDVTDPTSSVSWSDGWYTVAGNVTITSTVYLDADTHLILQDGAKLTVRRIRGGNNYSLSVYGQSNMSGELNVQCPDRGDAISFMPALNIHSCKVNASSSDIGRGGFYGITTFNVYGGSVDSEYTGSYYGWGFYGSLNIYGGEVKAVGIGNNSFSFGITGDTDSTLKVFGGKLWAECAGKSGINSSNVSLTKEGGFNGKIETSSNGTDWTEYSSDGTPNTPYVRVGY